MQKKFIAKGLESAFAKINKGMLEILVQAMEANVERFKKFKQNMKEAL